MAMPSTHLTLDKLLILLASTALCCPSRSLPDLVKLETATQYDGYDTGESKQLGDHQAL